MGTGVSIRIEWPLPKVGPVESIWSMIDRIGIFSLITPQYSEPGDLGFLYKPPTHANMLLPGERDLEQLPLSISDQEPFGVGRFKNVYENHIGLYGPTNILPFAMLGNAKIHIFDNSKIIETCALRHLDTICVDLPESVGRTVRTACIYATIQMRFSWVPATASTSLHFFSRAWVPTPEYPEFSPECVRRNWQRVHDLLAQRIRGELSIRTVEIDMNTPTEKSLKAIDAYDMIYDLGFSTENLR